MNQVSLIGILRENIDDNYRYFEYELPFGDDPMKKNPIIVVKNWTGQPKSRLLVMPSGSKIAVEAHLDSHEKFGTILVVEQFQGLK